jgi:hypothetical protein
MWKSASLRAPVWTRMMTNTQQLDGRNSAIVRVVGGLVLLVPLITFVFVTTARDATAAKSKIRVTAPTDGAVVPASFPVRIRTNVPIGEPDTGRHHIHLYWDGERDEGKYDIVYKKHFTKRGLAPGTHTLDAVIANADHSTTDTHQKIDVMVSKDAPPMTSRTPRGSTDSTASTSGGGY